MGAVDGAALRRRWDEACDAAATVLGRHLMLAAERDQEGVADYLRGSIHQLRVLQLAVDARRVVPGGSVAPGLIRDAPVALWHDPYREAGASLDLLTDLYCTGLGELAWDWSRGFPPSWPTSARERLARVLLARPWRR